MPRFGVSWGIDALRCATWPTITAVALASHCFVVYLSAAMASQVRSLGSQFAAVSTAAALSLVAFASTAWAKLPKLSTIETPVARCASKDVAGPKRCEPQGGFSIIDTKTDMSDFRMVVQEDKGFQIFLEPAGCNEVRYEAPLQWRVFEEQPFAVIQAAKCFDTNHALKEKNPKPGRTVFVVRGLTGFEGLHVEIDAGKNRNAARDAVAAADKFLKEAWPQIEAKRAAAESAEKQVASEQEVEDTGNKPVSASQKREK